MKVKVAVTEFNTNTGYTDTATDTEHGTRNTEHGTRAQITPVLFPFVPSYDCAATLASAAALESGVSCLQGQYPGIATSERVAFVHFIKHFNFPSRTQGLSSLPKTA